jgi:hypothetical protein
MLSTIILGSQQLLVSPLSSTSVTINYGSLNLSFGKVELVNQLSEKYQIGQKILYNNTGQISVSYLGVQYFLINESTIKLIAP